MDNRLASLNVKSLYISVSLKLFTRELEEYGLDLVDDQEVRGQTADNFI
jgi:hypothetical protein